MRKRRGVRMRAIFSRGRAPIHIPPNRKTGELRQWPPEPFKTAPFKRVKLKNQDLRAPASLNVISIIVAIVIVATTSLISLQVSCHSVGQISAIAQRHQQDAPRPDLNRLIALLLSLSEQAPSETLSERNQPPSATGGHQLRKLLARPRRILSSFVPQLLSGQRVLRRPKPQARPVLRASSPTIRQSSKAPTRAPFIPSARPSSQSLPHNPRATRPSRPRSPIVHKLGRPPPAPQDYRFESMRAPQQIVSDGSRDEVSLDEAQLQAVIGGQEVAGSSAILPAPVALPNQLRIGAREERVELRLAPAPFQTEPEQGMQQIDELIKKEFESRMNINEYVTGWQNQPQAGGGNSSWIDRGASSESHHAPEPPEQPADSGQPEAAANGASLFIAVPTRQFAASSEQPEDSGQFPDEAYEHTGATSSTSISLVPERDSWRPTDYPAGRPVERQRQRQQQQQQQQQREQNRDQAFAVERKLRHSQTAPTIEGSQAAAFDGRPSMSEHLAMATFGDSSRPPVSAPRILQRQNAAAAFVPSAEETIAQLRLNQTNQRHRQQAAHYERVSSLDFAARPQRGSGQELAQPAALNQPRHISLVNGKPMSASPANYVPMASENHLNQHQSGSVVAAPTRNVWPGQQLGGSQANGGGARPAPPNDLRDTLKRLRETKARIRQLQAELNATQPPQGFLMTAAETNKTVTRYAHEQARTERPQEALDEPEAANLRSGAQQAGDWSRALWSSWGNANGGHSLLVPARMVHAQQSMNMPLGLYHKGPLTTPARLVASALGRAVHQSAGQQQHQDWSSPARPPASSAPGVDLRAMPRPSSAPILLSSTISVAGELDLAPATTFAPRLSLNESPRLIGNKIHHRRPIIETTTTTTATSTTTTTPTAPSGNNGLHQRPDAQGQANEEPLTSGERPHNGLSSSALASNSSSSSSSNSSSSNNNNSQDDVPKTAVKHSAGATMPALITSSPPASGAARSDIPKAAESGDQRQHANRRQQTPFVHNEGGHLIQQLDHQDKRLSSAFHQHAKPAPATESPIMIVEPASRTSFHSHSPAKRPIGLTRAAVDSSRLQLAAEIVDETNSTRVESGSKQQQQQQQQEQQHPEDRQMKSKRQETGSESGQPAGINFLAQLLDSLIGLFASASARAGGADETPASNESAAQKWPKVAGSLLHQRQLVSSRQAGANSAGKLTTERVVHSLIVIVCSLALATMLVVFAFVRCQQVRHSRRRTLVAECGQQTRDGVESSVFAPLTENASASSGAKLQHGSGCPAGLDWRRLGPVSLIVADQQRRQQHQQANKIILDGTMRNVSLLARHRLSGEHCARESRESRRPRRSAKSARPADEGAPPASLMNRSCCHCVACSESWLCRADELASGLNCLASSFCRARGKLPFGAASSVNNMLQRAAGLARSPSRAGANRKQPPDNGASDQDGPVPKWLMAGDAGSQPMACNQRIPIGGTRLRMMSAIEERLNASGAATDDDHDDYQLEAACAAPLTSDSSHAGELSGSPGQHQCGCNKASCHQHQHPQRRPAAAGCCGPEDGVASADQSSSFPRLDRLDQQQQQQEPQHQCSKRCAAGHKRQCQHNGQQLGDSREQLACQEGGETKKCNNYNCCQEN